MNRSQRRAAEQEAKQKQIEEKAIKFAAAFRCCDVERRGRFSFAVAHRGTTLALLTSKSEAIAVKREFRIIGRKGMR